MERLKVIITGERIYTFISDRHSEFIEINSNCLSKFLSFFLLLVFEAQLESKYIQQGRRCTFILKKFKKVVYAPTHEEFQIEYENFVKLESQQANKFLANVPLGN